MMGLKKCWSQEEIEYLEEKWGEVSIKGIADKINRSENAIILRAKRMGMESCYHANEYMNAHQISKIMGVDSHAVTDYWIAKCGLKAKKTRLHEFYMWFVSLPNLMKWLKSNQDKWDSRKVELNTLTIEPEWLKEKRKQDINLPRHRYEKWTKEQNDMLICYYKAGKKQHEIGILINRSISGVQRKISRLKEKGILPMNKIMCKWTEREEILFRELDARGLIDLEIAKELGREREHIADHRRNLRSKGLYQGNKNNTKLKRVV